MEAASQLIADIYTKTPGGCIAFVPSYKFQERLKISFNKKFKTKLDNFFYDEKSAKGDTFELFKARIESSEAKSALLFSVMGGRLSEGINFKDRLARSVICIGMPYPNIKACEIGLKMKFFDEKSKNEKSEFSFSGRDFYESLCTKAVNQSIGRAIRHRGDYSAIFLVDLRFGKNRFLERLPGWIRGSYRAFDGPGDDMFNALDEFYKKLEDK